nr:NADH dehydrogenase subunit 6 [Tropiduchidae sp. 1 WQW-2023a]
MSNLTIMILTISMITPLLNHPISMGTTLMMQTILISILMFKTSASPWFSYILFITIIGGMMVMFMYMSSIASNEKFKMNLLTFMIIPAIMTITWMNWIAKDYSMEFSTKMKITKAEMITNKETKALSKFFNSNKMNLTIIMMITLLITMIAVTNISSTFEGPLKKTYV